MAMAWTNAIFTNGCGRGSPITTAARSTTSPTPSGLLFATGLYAIYQTRGAAFVPDYIALLASTGEGSAADLAARFGINLRERAFWQASLDVIGQRIERYCAL